MFVRAPEVCGAQPWILRAYVTHRASSGGMSYAPSSATMYADEKQYDAPYWLATAPQSEAQNAAPAACPAVGRAGGVRVDA